MTNKKTSSIKKEIFLPSKIGDWTTYTSEKNKESISITKSIGASNKAISEPTLHKLLFFHQELFQDFFEEVANEINSHIDIDSVSIDLMNHKLLKESLNEDIYQCKYSISELEQIDLILTNRAAKCISHRLCGGNTFIEEFTPITSLEVTLVSVINNIFIKLLSEKWKTIFPYVENCHETTYGSYEFKPQQAEDETIVEVSSEFKLLGHNNLSIKVIYSLETIEKLLFFEDMISSNINDNLIISKEVISETKIPVKSIIGTTTLALDEIQNIEIGDVIFLENQDINEPIQLIIGDDINFHVTPIKANERHLGVQILNHQHYDAYLKENSKPTSGPFITSQSPTPAAENNLSSNNNIETNSFESNQMENTDQTLQETDQREIYQKL